MDEKNLKETLPADPRPLTDEEIEATIKKADKELTPAVLEKALEEESNG